MATAHHILTYAETLSGGGVERAQLRLARGWIALGRRVTLVIGDPTGPLAAEIPPGLEVITGAARALPTIIRTLAPDIVFCPGNHYTGIAAWIRIALRGACPPIVAKMSNAPDRGDHGPVLRAAHRFWLARHARFLDHLVAMTPATAAEAAAATRMHGRVSVIPNPPALSGPAPSGPTAPNLPLPPRFILGVGRLEPQKRWDRLIAALDRVADRDTALVILGEGTLRPALEAQVRSLGLDGRVHLPGHVADPLSVMRRARVVALTSTFEGVPGVLREALRQGHHGPIRVLHMADEHYLDEPLRSLAQAHPNLLVEQFPAGEPPPLRLSSRQTIALVCGSPASVEAYSKRLYIAGLPRSQLLADVFHEKV